jgi:hypothetical protein
MAFLKMWENALEKSEYTASITIGLSENWKTFST